MFFISWATDNVEEKFHLIAIYLSLIRGFIRHFLFQILYLIKLIRFHNLVTAPAIKPPSHPNLCLLTLIKCKPNQRVVFLNQNCASRPILIILLLLNHLYSMFPQNFHSGAVPWMINFHPYNIKALRCYLLSLILSFSITLRWTCP